MEKNRLQVNAKLRALLLKTEPYLNQSTLSRYSKVDASVISRCKSGKRVISHSDALALCQVLQQLMKALHSGLNDIGASFK